MDRSHISDFQIDQFLQQIRRFFTTADRAEVEYLLGDVAGDSATVGAFEFERLFRVHREEFKTADTAIEHAKVQLERRYTRGNTGKELQEAKNALDEAQDRLNSIAANADRIRGEHEQLRGKVARLTIRIGFAQQQVRELREEIREHRAFFAENFGDTVGMHAGLSVGSMIQARAKEEALPEIEAFIGSMVANLETAKTTLAEFQTANNINGGEFPA